MAEPAKKPQKTSVPTDKMLLYERLLGAVEGVESKTSFGAGYTAVDGNMYTMISKHGVVGIRLPAPERAAFLERFQTELFRGDPSWPPAKEFVAVPDTLLSDTSALRPYLEIALRYAQSLKPKASRRTGSGDKNASGATAT